MIKVINDLQVAKYLKMNPKRKTKVDLERVNPIRLALKASQTACSWIISEKG